MKKMFGVIKSVLASMLGVQSQQNYENDFAERSALPYIITGIVIVVLFVISLIVLVNFLT